MIADLIAVLTPWWVYLLVFFVALLGGIAAVFWYRSRASTKENPVVDASKLVEVTQEDDESSTESTESVE